MAPTVQLRGITWDHTRGYLPMVATAQRYWEQHGVEITWHKRSLQEFGDFPLERLVDKYDLLIIDHPFVGYADNHTVLLPLETCIPADYLQDQEANSVGASFKSYRYGGHQWALATDAATPVASYRPDLLARHGLNLPDTWEDLLEFAETGLVIVPSIPIDSLMNLYYLLASRDVPLFKNDLFVEREAGEWGLEQLHQLIRRCPHECLERNPIKTYDALASGDTYVYCPFAYGYSNYGREGYAQYRLKFADVVGFKKGEIGRTALGGTGIAISARCQHKEIASGYAQYVNSALIQRTLYVENGGQPGHRCAWLDDAANAHTNNFFRDTLVTLDNAYLRPRFDGYLNFQDYGGSVVHDYLKVGGNPEETLTKLQKLYERSLVGTDLFKERA